MDGYISIIFLISAALTFHGTEATIYECYDLCRQYCARAENPSGQNCCRDDDYAGCRNGRCDLSYMGTVCVFQCSDLVYCPEDNSSEETTTRRNQSMMNYTRRGRGSRGCPGSLEDCIAACPSSVRAFKVCTANCEKRCSKK